MCSATPSPTICSMVIRGESDPNGSWNTTCIRRRIARSVGRSASSIRVPSSVTLPAAIGCSASSAMPSVVLPEPDSPTMPSVSPRFNSSVALRTARNTSLPNQPRDETKSTLTDLHRREDRRIRSAPAEPHAAAGC